MVRERLRESGQRLEISREEFREIHGVTRERGIENDSDEKMREKTQLGVIELGKEIFDCEWRLGERKRESKTGWTRRTEWNMGRGRAIERKRECERLNERGRRTMSGREYWREDNQKKE